MLPPLKLFPNSNKEVKHYYMLVVPKLTHSVYIGADILVRLAAQLDTVNNILWSQAAVDPNDCYFDL